MTVLPNDKNVDGEVVDKKVKVKAKNEPVMEQTVGSKEDKDLSMPTGDADDVLLGNK